MTEDDIEPDDPTPEPEPEPTPFVPNYKVTVYSDGSYKAVLGIPKISEDKLISVTITGATKAEFEANVNTAKDNYDAIFDGVLGELE